MIPVCIFANQNGILPWRRVRCLGFLLWDARVGSVDNLIVILVGCGWKENRGIGEDPVSYFVFAEVWERHHRPLDTCSFFVTKRIIMALLVDESCSVMRLNEDRVGVVV